MSQGNVEAERRKTSYLSGPTKTTTEERITVTERVYGCPHFGHES